MKKNANQVLGRESSTGYSLSLGKVLGACMMLNYIFKEDENGVILYNENEKKVVEVIL